MSVGLRGNLLDFGIGEVFQLIGQQGKTGVLEIAGGEGSVQLRFDHGAVVDAVPVLPGEENPLGQLLVRCGLLAPERLEELAKESQTTLVSLPRLLRDHELLATGEIREMQDLLTRETLFMLLRWKEGSFHFRAEPVVHERAREDLLGAEEILMDGLRMVDEWRAFADAVPSEELILERSRRFEAFRSDLLRRGGSRLPLLERVYAMVDGRASVRRIIDLSRLGTFEATRTLAELRAAGMIAPAGPRQVARARRPGAARPRRTLRAWALSAGACVALFCAGLLVDRAGSPSSVESAVPIVRDPLAATGLRFATQRLRHAAEAFHFVTGRWPASLAELADAGLLPPDALAATEAAPYYYVQRSDGILLLAPPH